MLQKRYAYVSFISDSRYIPGFLTMQESMKRVNTKYPLIAALPPDASKTLIKDLDNNNIKYVFLDNSAFPLKKEDFKGLLNFYYSFERLGILKLTQFDKVVYLDSDLLFISNSDDLFDKPHFSSVVSGKCSHPSWEDLCSGLIVIEPSVSFYNDIIASYDKAKAFRLSENGHERICDQDLFTVYNDFYWRKHKELHLQETYDCLDHEVDLVLKKLNINFNSLHIIHMASSPKVWFRTKKQLLKNCLSCIVKNRPNQLRAYVYYIKLLKLITKRIVLYGSK